MAAPGGCRLLRKGQEVCRSQGSLHRVWPSRAPAPPLQGLLPGGDSGGTSLAPGPPLPPPAPACASPALLRALAALVLAPSFLSSVSRDRLVRQEGVHAAPLSPAAAAPLSLCPAASSRLACGRWGGRQLPPTSPPAPFSASGSFGPGSECSPGLGQAGSGVLRGGSALPPGSGLCQLAGWESEGHRHGAPAHRCWGTGQRGLSSGPRPRGQLRCGQCGRAGGWAVWTPFTLFCPLLSRGCLDPSGFLALRMAGAGAQG